VQKLKRIKANILCLLIITTFFAGLSFKISPAYAATTYMRVSPSNVSATLNETFSLSVVIENVVGMYGYQFQLYWINSLLTCTQWNYTTNKWIQDPSTPPSQWGSNIYLGKQEIADMTDGRSRYWLVVSATNPAPSVSGTFSVVTLNFKVIGVGQSLLDLDKTKIGDQFANSITHTVVDGSFRTIIRDIELVRVEPKSSKVIQNNTVEIDVEVKNKGNVAENFTVSTYYNSTTTGVVGLAGTQNVVNLASNALKELTFDWNTTGVEADVYQIFANASILEKELNTTNNQLIDGTIEVAGEVVRDIAVSSFTSSLTIVAEGEFAAINVTVRNYGLVNENNLNLTVYCNNTLLETKMFPPITPGGRQKYSFNWNTTGKLGFYVLRANVTILPDEFNPADNEQNLTLTITETPIANFTISPATPMVKQKVTFNASTSYDPDGWIVNYTWDFGDSTYLGHGAAVTHRYTDEGTFKVTLIVKDNAGLTYNLSRVFSYPGRIEKNVTIQGAAVGGSVPQDLLYLTVIVVISIVALIVIYLKFPQKPKEQK
jgi:PKD repeat protein